MRILITVSRIGFLSAMLLLAFYAVRHYVFAVYRLSLRRARDFSELEGFDLPRLSVIVPMHNEQEVASDILEWLVNSDYDLDRLEILAVNDRSTDATAAIIDGYARQYPVIHALHRATGNGGKAGALEFATAQANGEVLMIFDADYVPGRGLLKMLAAPFGDPQIGAVMGRVVPHNAGATLMSGLLSLERAAGYQVGQQARYNLGLAPQFGGTVGGVRASALRAVGGWNTYSLTEDTDLTCRLLLRGWKVAYVNRAECYEEVPQSWAVRRAQLRRWVIGHTDCLHRFGFEVIRCRFLGFWERIDLLMMLACYWTAPLLVLGWISSVALFLAERPIPAAVLLLALPLIGGQMFANQAGFFELAAAGALDRDRERILLLPLTIVSFFASTGTICRALITYYSHTLFGRREFDWHKTIRYRVNGNGNGNGGSNGPGRPNGTGGGHA